MRIHTTDDETLTWWHQRHQLRKRGAGFDGAAGTVEPLPRSETLRLEILAGMVPVPVVAKMAGSACWRHHQTYVLVPS
ncbi:hypothetical protein V6N13_047769 [Hibiscus sabdariffa]|uniref:Uncharacterized protein n=1 Tax=Hibiscus sabdariffa TaxID=183260 RepID=A0ABR2F556_9ROSI